MGRPAGGLEEWLRGRSDAELIELLRRRPDAASARSFSDLADRLSTPWSVSAALDSADTAMLQLLEVLQALGDGVEAGLVERFLGKPPGAPLERLLRLGLVWRLDDGRLRIAKPVADLTETPLGLGRPVAELLPALSVDQLKAIAASYGDRTQRRKAEWIALLTGVLTDAERILSTFAALPSPVAGTGRTTRRGWSGSVGCCRSAGTPGKCRSRSRSPFARTAAVSVLDGARRLVELTGRSPLATVRAGGVGSRELTKALAATEARLRLWLETLASAGLVVVHNGRAMPTTYADDWLGDEPAGALVALLRAWWKLDRLPTHYRDETGKATPALAWARPSAAALRADLLTTLDELPADAGFCDLDAVVARLVWQRPSLYGNARQARPLVEATVTEAELLGVVAERALTPLGRALLRGDELRSVAADLLPAPATTATFLPDLTALVSGAPAAELAALLDTAADQESRDAASTWRFTPASVRRAFDTGRTADELLTALSAIADRPLPQPLSYLIRDVARRHGQLRVVAAGCCVVANDPALATELANHRQLANLRLRLLGDTVLASAQPAATVLAALRDAGYAPVQQNARGTTVIERHEPHRAPPAARSPRPIVDPPTLAAAVQRLLTDAIERHQPIVIQYVSAGGTHTTRVIEPEHLITPVLVAWCHLREAERHFLLSSITATAPVS